LNRDDQITIKIQQTLFIMSLFQDIESIEDHRVDANKNYELSDIIFLTIAAILCGAKGWKAINIFGVAQLDWLKEYRDFSHGIPTRHSIGRIITSLKEDESQIYADDGAINLATIRRKLLNLIKAHPLKDNVAGKMQRACWDAKFRAEILFG
jgi:hypothetical protein